MIAILILGLGLFHHHHKKPQPSPENTAVAVFVETAQKTLASYQDGSLESYFEKDYIAQIDADIQRLKNAETDSFRRSMMLQITDEMRLLQWEDADLQTLYIL